MIKCELIIDGYSYKITDDVMNWDDVTISLKRGNYDGVVRSFTSKFEFVNTAYALLKKQYQDNYLGAAASIVISRRNNSWTWNELFRCTLDFSTYSDDGSAIAINAVDDTLAAIIKAKKSIQYEYPVDTMKDEKPLYYDGLNMTSIMTFYPFSKIYGKQENKNPEGDEVVISIDRVNADNNPTYDFPLSYSTSSEVYDMRYVSIIDDTNNPGRLIVCNEGMIKTLDIHFKFLVIGKHNNHFNIFVYSKYFGIEYRQFSKTYQFIGTLTSVDCHAVLTYFGIGDTEIIIRFSYTLGDSSTWIALRGDKFVTISYTTRLDPININVIKPITTLNPQLF